MPTLDLSINIPQNNSVNISMLKEMVLDYANKIITSQTPVKPKVADEDMQRALAFVKSLAVPGGKEIPFSDNGCDALAELKY